MEKNKNESFLLRTNFAYQLILNLSAIHLTENIFILKIVFLTIHRNNQMVNHCFMLSGGQSECFKQNNVQNTYINCHDYERFSLQ